jgi:hypothetical protein
MKFTRDWLFSHLETDRPLAEILDVLPMLGLEGRISCRSCGLPWRHL